MKILYLITAYNEPELLDRTIERLRHPNSLFYIHIDKRVDDAIFRKLIIGSDIYFLTDSQRIYSKWGDISTCDAILNLMRCAISDLDALDKGYCVVMSGSDYPIKSAQYIYSYFEEHYPINFIHNLPLKNCTGLLEQLMKSHIYHYWLSINGKLKIEIAPFKYIRPRCVFRSDLNWLSVLNLIQQSCKIVKLFFLPRHYPIGLECHAAETWFEITIESVTMMLDFVEANPAVYEYHTTVGLPEETFFQSIILSNSLIFKSQVKDFLIFLDRERPGKKGRLEISYDDKESLLKAIQSADRLFTRKCSMSEHRILDVIDHLINSNK